MSRLDPAGRVIQSPVNQHQTYTTGLAGQYSGQMAEQLPSRNVWTDFWNRFDAMPQRGAHRPNNPDRAFQSNYIHGIHQVADDQWVEQAMAAQAAIRRQRGY